MLEPALIVAVIAAVLAFLGAVASAWIATRGARRVRLLEGELQKRRESAEFLAARLEHFYMPLSSSLTTTKSLFNRYAKAGEDEKATIEHELRIHNDIVRKHLLEHSVYAEPDTPPEFFDDLLAHLTQWEIVYRLKYEYRVYDGPVFAGIQQFGYQSFPQGADRYFRQKAAELRTRFHELHDIPGAGNRPVLR